jgi:hypothetical protein
MSLIPIKPHKGRQIYCIVDNKTGQVLGTYKEAGAKTQAEADCPEGARVEVYVQKPTR